MNLVDAFGSELEEGDIVIYGNAERGRNAELLRGVIFKIKPGRKTIEVIEENDYKNFLRGITKEEYWRNKFKEMNDREFESWKRRVNFTEGSSKYNPVSTIVYPKNTYRTGLKYD